MDGLFEVAWFGVIFFGEKIVGMARPEVVHQVAVAEKLREDLLQSLKDWAKVPGLVRLVSCWGVLGCVVLCFY